jgi:hypothetical protein
MAQQQPLHASHIGGSKAESARRRRKGMNKSKQSGAKAVCLSGSLKNGCPVRPRASSAWETAPCRRASHTDSTKPQATMRRIRRRSSLLPWRGRPPIPQVGERVALGRASKAGNVCYIRSARGREPGIGTFVGNGSRLGTATCWRGPLQAAGRRRAQITNCVLSAGKVPGLCRVGLAP